MAIQVKNGKAFEWAVAKSISEITNFKIAESPEAELNQNHYLNLDEKKRTVFDESSLIAIDHILKKESKKLKGSGTITFNSDSAGKEGDVRDVIIKLDSCEIGFSCKTNHEALKHSRLSKNIDFVTKWGLHPDGCSQTYWDKVNPIFMELEGIAKNSKTTALWSDFNDKANRVYWPILNAWEDEIRRIKSISEDVEKAMCKNMLHYLIGKDDFYKVISHGRRYVDIHAYNFNNTLATRRSKLPEFLNSINDKNGTQYSKTITFNGGYSINFRIHSASSRVEPSLKFDIAALGLPTGEIYQQTFD